jgi:predicted ATPase/DNA-binding SARP family transcriptional activator
MDFRILGPVEVVGDRGALRLGGAKPRAILAVLALHANESVSAERLALALWGEDAPPSAVKRIQVHVSRLRKALGDAQILSTTPAGYRLHLRPGELDAERFAQLLDEGRRALAGGQAEQAAALLRQALALWRGPALADLAFEPFAPAEIARLEEQRLAALEARVAADLLAGRHAELVGELSQLVNANPAREPLAGQLMLALYRCGRQRDALEVYTRTHAYLTGELGLDPGTALKNLQRGILEQAPWLDLQVVAAAEPDTDARLFSLPAVLDDMGAADTFVGRAADLAVLAAVYAETLGGTRRLVFVSGEPGIGKTRLAAQFVRRASAAGAIVLYGRCDEERLLAQQPFVEALRQYIGACPRHVLAGQLQLVSGELRRLVPELAERVPDLPQPLAGDPEGARSRLFEAVCLLLCEVSERTPVVLVLDDLHWADPSTLLLLKYLARYPRESRLMVLGTYRETELDFDHPLGAILAELGRERRLQRHPLTPLDAAAVSKLVGIHVGEGASPELGRIVYEGTEGNALFVVEVLRHLAESGAIGTVGGGHAGAMVGDLAVPDGVKDVVAQRVRRLGAETHRLLVTASVLGREFELAVLARLSPLAEDDMLDGLESAVLAHVVEEVAGEAGRYTFSHALIRDTLYGTLGATRRVVMHRRAGASIEDVHRGDIEAYLPELAHHFARAGSTGDLDKAIEYGMRAGEHATVQLAYEQAATHFRQTAELIDAVDPERLRRQRCDLVIAQGEAERQAGEASYRKTLLGGARLAQQLRDPARLARAALANNRGIFSSGQGVDRERVSVLQAALDTYDGADSATRAALLALLALELVTDHDASLRDRLNTEAVAMARRVGDQRTLALVLTQRCVAQWTPSQTLADRQANLREAEAIADRLSDPLLVGHAAYLGAHAAMNAGDLAEADRLLARLRTVADELAQPFMRWYDKVAHAKRAAISGPAAEAERLAFVALEVGRRGGQPDSMLWFLGQILAARFLNGTLERGDPHMPGLVATPGASIPSSPEITPSRSAPLLIGAGMSMILCEVGRLADARGHFDWVMRDGLDDLPPDYQALTIPVYASVACAALGDKPRAERLHAILEPERHRLVTTGAAWFGTTAHYLGLLAATLDRLAEAEADFASAARTYASLDAKPWLERLSKDRAAALGSPR